MQILKLAVIYLEWFDFIFTVLIDPIIDISPAIDFLTSATGRMVEKYTKDSISVIHWFKIVFLYKNILQKLQLKHLKVILFI